MEWHCIKYTYIYVRMITWKLWSPNDRERESLCKLK